MIINYELNPPKILQGECFDRHRLFEDIETIKRKISVLEKYIDGIHFTDSVLGIPRLSSRSMADIIKRSTNNQLKISCSVRTRDRNFMGMCQIVTDSILSEIDSLLILLGDQPIEGPKNNNPVKPSVFVSEMNKQGFNQFVKFNLSIPNKINNSTNIKNKIEAKPYAFVTQSIESLCDLEKIVDIVNPYKIKIVACIMLPSEKNRRSAHAIGLDWKEYEKSPIEFIMNAGKLADEILLTSPNHFGLASDILSEIRS